MVRQAHHDFNISNVPFRFGRTIGDIQPLLDRLRENSVALFMEPEEKWYEVKGEMVGCRQFLVQDPDGYLLRFVGDV